MKKVLHIITLMIVSCALSYAGNTMTPEVNEVNSEQSTDRLMLIPDSLASQVQSVINGNSKIVRDYSRVNLDEKVVVKGDTVPLFLRDRNLGRYDRGLLNYLYIPKGSWHFGLSASYSGFDASDVQMLSILSDLDFGGSMFSIKPSVSYFISNNLSVGVRLGYTQGNAKLGSMGVDFDEDINFEISDASYKTQSYTAAVNGRYYIGLTRNGRFGVFNEVELAFSSGNSDFTRNYAGSPRVTHTTFTDARLNFSPGLSVFMMKNVSFNISLGVFGLYLKNEKQVTDGVYEGSRFTSGANFKFNLFNINFGLGVHI